MKRLASGVLIGLLLVALFSAPWMYRAAYAVGSCATFRTWNTGDAVTAGDLNSSFATAAVTNSTPQCLDDYSATVSQMQSTADPFASGTESLATSTAGEIERLRFMFKQIFGLTQWYRHDQAPTFSFSHMNASALHLSSVGVAGGTDTTQNQFLARFPVLTGPNHWTGIWWPHNTTHMAISIADYNHAQGGVQGGIELFRFHARGLIFHHTVVLMFKHSESGMHGGQRGHVTALSIDPTTDQLILGHRGATLRIDGTGISGVGGTNKALFLSSAGHVYVNTVSAGGGSFVAILRPEGATLPSENFPLLAKHAGAARTRYALMYSDVNSWAAHWSAAMPSGATTCTIEIYSAQGTRTTGTVGWHVAITTAGNGENPDAAGTVFNVYPVTVAGTAGQLTKQTETCTAILDSSRIAQVRVTRLTSDTPASEHTALIMGILRFQ